MKPKCKNLGLRTACILAVALSLWGQGQAVGGNESKPQSRTAVLKKEHPRVPVMIVSGSLNEAIWRRADRLGARCGLAKPFNAKTLRKAVAGALKGCGGRRPRRAPARTVPDGKLVAYESGWLTEGMPKA